MTDPLQPTPLTAGNWKMNGLSASTGELAALIHAVNTKTAPTCGILICPPYTLIAAMAAQAAGSTVMIGAQDCHAAYSGAHTGDISADMIADAGATHIIVGHSERRADHGESSELVKAKAVATHQAGLIAIICVGETDAERDAGKTLEVVGDQIARSIPDGSAAENTIIAYEPVWAIGTGRTPTVEDVADVHSAIRSALVARFGASGQAFALLYGGSVKPSNASELMAAANVNGALVGGASLKATDFDGIIDAYRV